VQEWTDPQYTSVVGELLARRTVSLTEPSPLRCRACAGFGVRMVIVPGGGRHALDCAKCNGTGRQPPRRRSRR
jgi:hypothetical protein